MTPVNRQPAATAPLPDNVVRLPVRVAPGPMGCLLTLVRLHGAWRRNNPGATFEEDMAAGEQLSKEIGTHA